GGRVVQDPAAGVGDRVPHRGSPGSAAHRNLSCVLSTSARLARRPRGPTGIAAALPVRHCLHRPRDGGQGSCGGPWEAATRVLAESSGTLILFSVRSLQWRPWSKNAGEADVVAELPGKKHKLARGARPEPGAGGRVE